MPTASIRVFCRFRPLNKREIELGGEGLSDFVRLTDEEINLKGMEKTVTFDRVFGSDTDQATIVSSSADSNHAVRIAGSWILRWMPRRSLLLQVRSVLFAVQRGRGVNCR